LPFGFKLAEINIIDLSSDKNTMTHIHINLEDLESYLSQKTCDHTFRHTFQWAANQGLPRKAIEGLINELEVACDCNLSEFIPDIGDTFEVEIGEKPIPTANKWLIPSYYVLPSPDKLYQQVIQSPNPSLTDIRNYAKQDEILIPSPFGYKSKYKMRKSWHFFVGLDSANPSEIGVVAACTPQSAELFFETVKKRALPGFENFDLAIASFYLESVEKLKLGHGVGVTFLDEMTDTGILKRIRITNRML